ncbi:MAG: RidA family protein [Bacteroidales bacterium]|nr:MAG: RidA family protein [Bacteroidales bacterium]
MDIISTSNAPMPAGHYSQAVVLNGIVYVSGQLPIELDRKTMEIGSIEEQTLQALKNVEQILIAANSNKSRVVKVTVYISDISLWGGVNEVYSQFFGKHKPARVIVPTKDLHYGYQIEIDVIAALND